jgi:hypothetical protein
MCHRLQAAATITPDSPAKRVGSIPIDRSRRCWQQRFDARQQGFGAH